MSISINLHFPYVDYTLEMPAVPRKGDTVDFSDPEGENTMWHVTEVTHTVYADGTQGSIHIALDPADEHTKEASELAEAKRLAALRDRTTEQ